MEVRRVQLSEIEVAYIEDGDVDAPLAVCLHGFPDHAHTYDALLPALAAAGYHAVAPWLRGYAPSSVAPDGLYEVPKLAVDCIDLIDALGGGSAAAIVGHDWGAAVAHSVCAIAPDKIGRAVTMAVPHFGAAAQMLLGSYDQQKRSFYVFVFQLEGMAEAIVSANDMDFLDRLIADWSPGWTRTEADRTHLRDAIGAPENLTAALSYYRQMMPTNLNDSPEMQALRTKAAAPISTPTLQLFGRDDGCMDPGIIPDQSAFFPGRLEVEVLSGAGHFLLQDDPDTVVRRILDWFVESG